MGGAGVMDNVDPDDFFRGHTKPNGSGDPDFIPPPFMDLMDLDGVPVPPRRWLVPDLLPASNVGLLSGHGGSGKSTLLLQLAAGSTLARSWLNWMPTAGPAMVIACEDDEDELHFRLSQIARFHDVSFRQMALGGLRPLSFAGKDAILATKTRDGLIKPTKLFDHIYETAVKDRPVVITIDNVSDVYAGEENVRSQVRQFVTMMRHLSIDSGAHVLMSLHPSMAGLRDDTGLSGSTAWFNSVRSQLYLKIDEDEEGTVIKGNAGRTLEARKNQYGPLATSLSLRWSDGLYLAEREGQGTIFGHNIAQQKAEEVFIKVIIRMEAQGRYVSPRVGQNYAPTRIAESEEAKAAGIKFSYLLRAMEQLLKDGRIKHVETGAPSRRRSKLVVVPLPSE